MNTARLLVPIFTLQDFLYLLLDFLLAGFRKIPEFLAAGCEKIALCGIALMLCHQAEVFPEEDHKEDHIQGQQGIRLYGIVERKSWKPFIFPPSGT